MATILVFPDAEELFRVALQTMLDEVLEASLPVGTKPPNPRPSEFVVVRRIGGIARDLVTDVPLILVEAWAATESRASRIAAVAQGLMHWFYDINGYAIYEVDEISGPVNFPDGQSAQARYTATYSVAIRGKELITLA